MRRVLISLLLAGSLAHAQTSAPPPPNGSPSPSPVTLRSTLLQQLRSTHNKADWFVPLNTAVADLTPEGARWVPRNAAGKLDPDVNHSVGMIANHLLFYNTRALARLRHEKAEDAPADNEETFNRFDAARWSATVQGLDTVMTAIEQFVEQTDDATLAKDARLLADLSTHNAYHTGQIVYVRKLAGTWNPDKGVK